MEHKSIRGALPQHAISSLVVVLLSFGALVIAAGVGCQQKPSARAMLHATEIPDSIQVFIDPISAQEGDIWRKTQVKKGESVQLAPGAKYNLIAQAAPVEQPDPTQSVISYEFIQPQKALMIATFKDLNGAPIRNLPVTIECPTLSGDQIRPSQTETDSNGMMFSVIEGPPGISHTIYIEINGTPFLFKNLQFRPYKGTLIVMSQPPGAIVYLNQEEKPRGTTPLTLILNQQRRYTLKIQKPEYKSITDTIDFTAEQTTIKLYYTLEPIQSKEPLEPASITASTPLEASKEPLEPAPITEPAPVEESKPENSQPLPLIGTLIITSQPLNAAVYLNQEEKPRGTTPLALSLDQQQRYTLDVRKAGYTSKTESIAFTNEQTVIKNYILEPIKISGAILYEGSKEAVPGATVTIDPIRYSAISDAEGRFEFSDWEGHTPPEPGKQYTLRISDPQGRFLPLERQFNMEDVPLDAITVQRIFTLTVYVIDRSNNQPISDATVTVDARPAVRGGRSGLFVAKVTNSTKPVSIQVKHKDYESPQGKPIYEDSLQISPDRQNYFFPVPLSPILFAVQLPPDWETSNNPNLKFVAKRSARDNEEVQGTLEDRYIVFRSAPFLIAGRRIYVEMRENDTPLKGKGLEVKKYERIAP